MEKKNKLLPVSTMVNNIGISGTLNLMYILPLLKISHDYYIKPTNKQKIKLPPMKNPGDIIFAGNGIIKRGIIRSKKSNFKNCISMDIACKTKFINMRISPSSIHVCGAKTEEMIIDATNYLIYNICSVQNMLDRIKQNIDIMNNTINWIIENTKDVKFNIISGTNLIINTDDFIPLQNISTIDGMKYTTNDGKTIIGNTVNPKIFEFIDKMKLCYIKIKKKKEYTNMNDNNVLTILNYVNYIYSLLSLYKKCTIYKTYEYIKYIIHIYMSYQIPRILEYVDGKDPYKEFVKIFDEFIIYYNNNPVYSTVEELYNIKIPHEYYINNYPDNIDNEFANYLIQLSADYIFHDIYELLLKWIPTVDKLYIPGDKGILEINGNYACSDNDLMNSDDNYDPIKNISLNYNYNLGSYIILDNLVDEFEKYEDICVYKNKNYVTIHIPYEIPLYLKNKILKKQGSVKYVHSFLIYYKGSVTQSGPHHLLNEHAYNIFMNIFNSIKNLVCKRTSPSPIAIE